MQLALLAPGGGGVTDAVAFNDAADCAVAAITPEIAVEGVCTTAASLTAALGTEAAPTCGPLALELTCTGICSSVRSSAPSSSARTRSRPVPGCPLASDDRGAAEAQATGGALAVVGKLVESKGDIAGGAEACPGIGKGEGRSGCPGVAGEGESVIAALFTTVDGAPASGQGEAATALREGGAVQAMVAGGAGLGPAERSARKYFSSDTTQRTMGSSRSWRRNEH